MKNLLVIALYLAFSLVSFLSSHSIEKKSFLNALKQENAEYFQNIDFEKWKEGNKPAKSGLTTVQKYGIKSIPALVGGISNPNVEVRKAIYRELLFPDYFSKLGDDPQQTLSQDPVTKKYLELVREKLLAKTETDPTAENLQLQALQYYHYSLREAINLKNPRAIAYMTLEYFEKSNSKHEKTVIGRFGKRAVRTLVRALAVEGGDLRTKMKILDALMFTEMGGPERVIPKMSVRAKRAEELYLIADKLSNQSSLDEFRLKLLDVASAYIETSFELGGKSN